MTNKVYAKNYWQLFCGRPIDQQKRIPDFNKLGEHSQSFREYYLKNMEPICHRSESERIDALLLAKKRLRYLCIPTLAFSMILHYMFMASVPNEIVFQIVLSVLAYVFPLAFYVIYSATPAARLQKDVGFQLYNVALQYFGHKYKYSLTPRKSISDYDNSRVLPSFDRSSMGENISGEYNGVEFLSQTISLFVNDGKDNNNNQKYKKIFSGSCIEMSYQKKFQGITAIVTDKGKLKNLIHTKKGLERVRLEDPAFESKFEVYGSDQIEARYLLSVVTMELFMDLIGKYGDDIQMSFYRGKLLLLIPTRKHFFRTGMNIMSPIVFDEAIYNMFNEINTLHHMVDLLKLEGSTVDEKPEISKDLDLA